MTKNFRAMVATGVIAAAVITMATTALAANNNNGTRPGWGGTNPKAQGQSVGDQNHVHTGPPGQSVRP